MAAAPFMQQLALQTTVYAEVEAFAIQFFASQGKITLVISSFMCGNRTPAGKLHSLHNLSMNWC